MIQSFKDNDVRKSGIIYRSTFEQIKNIHHRDPVQAGEFAIAAIEQLLTGDISSDDEWINTLLIQNREINQKNANNYDLKVEQAKQRKICDQKLDEIASLFLAKKTQKEIATKLGLSQQTVSNRMALIRKEFPELLQEKVLVQASTNKVDENACTSKSVLVQDGTSKKVLVQEDTSVIKQFNF